MSNIHGLLFSKCCVTRSRRKILFRVTFFIYLFEFNVFFLAVCVGNVWYRNKVHSLFLEGIDVPRAQLCIHTGSTGKSQGHNLSARQITNVTSLDQSVGGKEGKSRCRLRHTWSDWDGLCVPDVTLLSGQLSPANSIGECTLFPSMPFTKKMPGLCMQPSSETPPFQCMKKSGNRNKWKHRKRLQDSEPVLFSSFQCCNARNQTNQTEKKLSYIFHMCIPHISFMPK